MKLNIAHEDIELLWQKAFFWPKESVLGISDLHIGKAESFQKLGVPIPSGSHLNDLSKLSGLINRTGAKQVYILGDFIHQKSGWTEQIELDLDNFFNRHQKVSWNLLVGNHDKNSVELLKRLPFKLFEDEIRYGPFLFTHGHSDKEQELFIVQGHIHPVIRIQEGSTRLRLPCFVLSEKSLIIPSFGELTGGFEIKPKKNEKIFAVAGKNIFQI